MHLTPGNGVVQYRLFPHPDLIMESLWREEKNKSIKIAYHLAIKPLKGEE